MAEHWAGGPLRRYLRDCAWPCSPDVARAIAADSGAPRALLLALELVPMQLYASEEALLQALVGATLCPAVAHIGVAAGLATVLVGRTNGQAVCGEDGTRNRRSDGPGRPLGAT